MKGPALIRRIRDRGVNNNERSLLSGNEAFEGDVGLRKTMRRNEQGRERDDRRDSTQSQHQAVRSVVEPRGKLAITKPGKKGEAAEIWTEVAVAPAQPLVGQNERDDGEPKDNAQQKCARQAAVAQGNRHGSYQQWQQCKVLPGEEAQHVQNHEAGRAWRSVQQ